MYFEIGRLNRLNDVRKNIFDHQKQVADYIKSTITLKEGEYISVSEESKLIIGNFLQQNYAMPQRDIVSCCSYPLGVFDYGTFRDYVETGKIKCYVTRKGIFEKEFAGASFANFTHVINLTGYSIFIHNNYMK